MNTFQKTEVFDAWVSGLKDKRGKAKILARISSAQAGNFGDCEPVGDGVSEMRIHYGPGYRVYFTRIGSVVYLLLSAGDKSSQDRDIRKAIKMKRDIDEEERR